MLSKCQICLEDANPAIVTPCGHIYCRKCLEDWMKTSDSECSQSCPTCKRPLKSEEFQELTSGVCSICKMKPKLPILTSSGSLSCWECHYKTLAPFTPIYGTDNESEENPDPAVPPRPILQPGVALDVNSRPSERTHVVPMDDVSSYTSQRDTTNASISCCSRAKFAEIFRWIGYVFGWILFIGLAIFPSVGVFFLDLKTNLVIGCLFAGSEFVSLLIGFCILPCLDKESCSIRVAFFAYFFFRLLSIIFFCFLHCFFKTKTFQIVWTVLGSISQISHVYKIFPDL